jgi:hypothetical protein
MLHLNVGPSALALGLLIPMTQEAGFEVCVVGRPGERSPNRFGISGSGPTGRLRYRQVDWFEGPESVDDLPPEVARAIDGPGPVLITGSLRGAISDRCRFITEVLQRRPSVAETIVLACENAPRAGYQEIRTVCEETGAIMLDTVVNRMCVTLPRDSEGRRMVSAHPLGEWLVARPQPPFASSILSALEELDEFETVDDIKARYDRKLWMVNGAHQALALMARRANADNRLEDGDDLRQALRPPTAARLGHIHNAMNEALRVAHPYLEGNIDYSVAHVEAYAEHPDSVARVLAAYRRLDLIPFLEALDERIAAPARICHERDLSIEPFSHIIDVFLELVANIDSFEDNIAVRSTPIAVGSDIKVVERFAAMLTPWAGESIEKQVGHFARLMADHREAFER